MNYSKMVSKNTVPLSLSKYFLLLRGAPKAGKTTFYADFVKEIFNGDASRGVLIPFEKGYTSIGDLFVFGKTVLPKMDKLDDDNKIVVDPITKKPQKVLGWDVLLDFIDYLSYDQDHIKFIGFDTVDEFMGVAEAKILDMSVRETKKPCNSINAAFGGYGKGKKRLGQMIKSLHQQLRESGLGIVFIGHTKHKTLKLKGTEEEYNVLGSNLNEDYDSFIANEVDTIGMITEERDIQNKEIVNTQRFLRLRGDGYYQCGSRLKDMPETIPFEIHTVVETFKNAIASQAGITREQYDVDVVAEMNGTVVKKNKIKRTVPEVIQILEQYFDGKHKDQESKIIDLCGEFGLVFSDPKSLDLRFLEDTFAEFL